MYTHVRVRGEHVRAELHGDKNGFVLHGTAQRNN